MSPSVTRPVRLWRSSAVATAGAFLNVSVFNASALMTTVAPYQWDTRVGVVNGTWGAASNASVVPAAIVSSARWNATLNAIVIDSTWPTQYIRMPPVPSAVSPRIACWVLVSAPGAVWSIHGTELSLVANGTHVVLGSAAAPVALNTWVFVDVTASRGAQDTGIALYASGAYVFGTVSRRDTLPGASYWSRVEVGGNGFAGAIAQWFYDPNVYVPSAFPTAGVGGTVWLSSAAPDCVSLPSFDPIGCDALATVLLNGQSAAPYVATGPEPYAAAFVELDGGSQFVDQVVVGAAMSASTTAFAVRVTVGDLRPPATGFGLRRPYISNPVCDTLTLQPGENGTVSCGGLRGRYVTVYGLWSSSINLALSFVRVTVRGPRAVPPPPPRGTLRTPYAYNWDASHVYAASGLSANALRDFGLSQQDGYAQGLAAVDDRIVFASSASSCAAFEAFDTPSDFTLVAHIVAPVALKTFDRQPVWNAAVNNGEVLLSLLTGESNATASLSLQTSQFGVLQSQNVALDQPLAPGMAAAVGVTCCGASCGVAWGCTATAIAR